MKWLLFVCLCLCSSLAWWWLSNLTTIRLDHRRWWSKLIDSLFSLSLGFLCLFVWYSILFFKTHLQQLNNRIDGQRYNLERPELENFYFEKIKMGMRSIVRIEYKKTRECLRRREREQPKHTKLISILQTDFLFFSFFFDFGFGCLLFFR